MQYQQKTPSSPGCEYGRICVGTRVFRVLGARDASLPILDPAWATLVLCGQNFVVVEVTEPGTATTPDDAVRRLTRREREIAVLVAQGHPNKVISYRLEISEWTVAAYLRRIYAKLNVESRAAMVYRCAAMIENLLEQTTRQEEPSFSEENEAKRLLFLGAGSGANRFECCYE